MPLRCYSQLSLCHTILRYPMPLRLFAYRINAFARLCFALLFHCIASLITAYLLYAFALPCSAMLCLCRTPHVAALPCLCLLDFFPHEPTFAAVSPLADAAETSVVEPFSDSFFVGIHKQDDCEFDLCARRYFFTSRK